MTSTPAFNDRFSGSAQQYQRYRPIYPPELFTFLAASTRGHERAWDCATGNGQCALGLTEHYRRVYATDASSRQLEMAPYHPRITWNTATAEHSMAPDHAFDLVTAAQSAHWFDHNRFYHEVRRVLRPGGVIAVWAYDLPVVNPETDSLVRHLYHDILGSYWQPEIRHISNRYRTLPFPFRKLRVPPFIMTAHWTCNEFIRYIETWSAAVTYRESRKASPLESIHAQLEHSWKAPGKRQVVRWPLIVLAGRTT